jgi:large subunit ribosomal protein L15e
MWALSLNRSDLMTATKHIKETFQKEYSGKDKAFWEHYKNKLIQWRREKTVHRIKKPTNPVIARQLGYKAKQGFVLVRVKIRRGSRKKTRPKKKRRPKRMGTLKMTPAKGLQRMAEERVVRHYKNLEVLNSYWVGEDGSYKFFEIILVDPTHPSIMADKDINWICDIGGRAYRGLTSAGRRSRSLRRN